MQEMWLIFSWLANHRSLRLHIEEVYAAEKFQIYQTKIISTCKYF